MMLEGEGKIVKSNKDRVLGTVFQFLLNKYFEPLGISFTWNHSLEDYERWVCRSGLRILFSLLASLSFLFTTLWPKSTKSCLLWVHWVGINCNSICPHTNNKKKEDHKELLTYADHGLKVKL